MLKSSRTFRHRCAILFALLYAVQANAQGRWPLVLQHGFNSDAGTWSSASSYFQQQLYVQPFSWTTGWGSHLNTQADALRSHMTSGQLPDSALIVGHSNGGLVARDASYYQPFRAIVTVGTLHTGAPLAQSVRDGSVTNYGWFMYNLAATAYNDYDFPDCCEDWWDNELYAARAAASDEAGLGLFIVSAAVYFTNSGSDALEDMSPNSAFLAELNGSTRMSHEAQTVPYRVGIRSSLQSWHHVIWDAIDPDNAANDTYLTWILEDEFLYAWDYYSEYYHAADPNEYWKRYYSGDWLAALAMLSGLNYSWCNFIGASNGGSCGASDAIVPFDRQTYPGATDAAIDISPGPPHSKEIDSPDFQSRTRTFLHDRVGVPTSSPPSVYIDGPTPNQPGTYTYNAIASGGIGGYQYRWYESGDGYNFADTGVTSSSYTAYFWPGPTWIRVVVTSGGQQSTAERVVDIPCNPYCN